MTGPLLWLAGDHHVHTNYSHDGTYSVARQAEAAARHGLAWLVVTDHGGPDHAKFAVGPTHCDVTEVRATLPQILLFQGLEWNVPGSEHGTVFFAPGRHEVALLQEFEQKFDGFTLYGDRCTESTFTHKSFEGLRWMDRQVANGRTASALFLINHPGRRGLVTPRHLREWGEVAPGVAVGMEGAPGHQAAFNCGEPRGIYDKSDSYTTFGGFDWMTATLGGAWDALLSRGRRWWITANSDSHAVAAGPGATSDGRDFWPGAYSRTVVGATESTYESVMEGIRKGRMWVVHGDLIWSLDVQLGPPGFASRDGVALGGRVGVDLGDDVEIRMRIGLPKGPNGSGSTPRLTRVDVISGPVAGQLSGDSATDAPGTSVVATFDIDRHDDELTIDHTFRSVQGPFYVRVRGTDGNHCRPGSLEPRADVPGADPWSDLWFYSNPVFVDVRA